MTASPVSPNSYPSAPQSTHSATNRCETLSSASHTSVSGNNSPVLPASTKTPYTSVWEELAACVRTKNLTESEEKALGNVEAQTEILLELTAKFDSVCDKAFKTLTMQPYYGLMTDDLKMAFYENYVWETMLSMTAAEFPGSLTALEEFKDWFFNTPKIAVTVGKKGRKDEYKENTGSDFDGGASLTYYVHDADGLRIGDGETEDRYADGETESTDGGAKLRWY